MKREVGGKKVDSIDEASIYIKYCIHHCVQKFTDLLKQGSKIIPRRGEGGGGRRGVKSKHG